MQDTPLQSTTQNVELPLSIINTFEQGLQARLEAYADNIDAPLEHFRQGEVEVTITDLKLAIAELRFLLNDFQMLQSFRK